MATTRTYCDGCAAAHALDLVDESAVKRFLTLFPLPKPAAPVAGA